LQLTVTGSIASFSAPLIDRRPVGRTDTRSSEAEPSEPPIFARRQHTSTTAVQRRHDPFILREVGHDAAGFLHKGWHKVSQ
jgi:hypothetical protein